MLVERGATGAGDGGEDETTVTKQHDISTFAIGGWRPVGQHTGDVNLYSLPAGTVVEFKGRDGWFVLSDTKKGKRVVLGPFDACAMRRILDDPTFPEVAATQ